MTATALARPPEGVRGANAWLRHLGAAEALAGRLGWRAHSCLQPDDTLKIETSEARVSLRPQAAGVHAEIWRSTAATLPRSAALPDPGDVATTDILSALGLSEADVMVAACAEDGHGPIDSLRFETLERRQACGGLRWTMERIAAPQTRAWLTRLKISAGRSADAGAIADALGASPRLWALPRWATIASSAEACDALRDYGHPFDFSPCLIVSIRTVVVGDVAEVVIWAATTWGGVVASLADAIGRVADPRAAPDDIRRAVDAVSLTRALP